MYLDTLQNPEIKSELNACFFSQRTQNLPPISRASFAKNENDLKALSAYFGGESGGNFGFLSGTFIELFLRLRNLKIGFALSNHQQAYQAYKLCKDICHFVPILPTLDEGIILKIPHCDVYLLPYINQDLLTCNPIAMLKEQALAQNPQSLFIIDVSYALARGERLDFAIDDQTIFLCDGESLGFLRGSGVFLGLEKHASLFSPTRYINEFYANFLQEVSRLQNTPQKEDKKEVFFRSLQLILSDDVSLFAPMTSLFRNTLPLRLKGIKARNLLQSLFLEKIFAINGQDCLFGFQSPSFVLQEMGYTELESRELLSLSFDDFDSSVVQRLALHYQNIKKLEI